MESATVIPWAAIARLAEPNDSPHWEEARSSLSIALWRVKNLSFQDVQVWAEGTIPSHDRWLLGNEFDERRAEVAMAVSQLSVIDREARMAFFYALSNLLINLGTRGSSAHHICMVVNMDTTSACSSPPLCVASRSRISLGATQV